MFNDSQKLQFAEAALSTFDLNSLHPIDTDKAIESLVEEVNDLISLNENDVKTSRAEYFKIPGTTPEDYSERLFEVGSKKAALAGIRHLSGDVKRPFVAIQTNYQVQTLDDLMPLAKIVRQEFSTFKPMDLNFWVNPQSEISTDLHRTLSPSQMYVASRLNNIGLSFKNPSSIKLTPIKDDSYREWYKEQYREFHADHPNLAPWVPINDVEEMLDAINDGLLFFASINGERIGMIGGKSESLLGEPAVYMLELLIPRPHKGKGLASMMQRQFLHELDGKFDLVWGTIDAKNLPSMKTALRVGRKIVRNEYFVPLDKF